MEHHHGGLVQIIFLSFHGWFVGSSRSSSRVYTPRKKMLSAHVRTSTILQINSFLSHCNTTWILQIHPRNLTWNLKISPWKRKVHLKTFWKPLFSGSMLNFGGVCKISTSWRYLQENGTHTQTKTKRNIQAIHFRTLFQVGYTSNQLNIQKFTWITVTRKNNDPKQTLHATRKSPALALLPVDSSLVLGSSCTGAWLKDGLVGGWTNHLKNMFVKLEHFPR